MTDTFMGCVVNIGSSEAPIKMEPHHDVKESMFSISYLCPFGNNSHSALILWVLEIIIKLATGDMFFLDSLIHHSIEFFL